MYNKLPENCEKVLKDLLESEDEIFSYWVLKYDYENMTVKEIDEFEGIAKQLDEYGYLKLSWLDGGPPIIRSVSNEARTYFNTKSESIKLQKKMNRREWRIAMLTAVVGALIGLLSYLIKLIIE